MENKRAKTILYWKAESTLRNKRAACRKAASGSRKITTWLSREISINNEVNNNHQLLFDEVFDEADSSDDKNNEFTLASLDALLKKKPEDMRLRTVSQFLHLVQDQGFLKRSANELLAQSINRGPWHARVIHS
jgi:hypothetical protein